MRDIRVSFAKIRQVLGYEPRISVEEGICEVRAAITNGLIKEPLESRYRNARFVVLMKVKDSKQQGQWPTADSGHDR